MSNKRRRRGPRALLLNASWTPICVVSAKRALMLVLTQKAEMVHGGDEVWHSATQDYPLPSVIRLLAYVKVPYKTKVPLTRKALLARDNYQCQYCGKTADTMDHVVPRSRGGAHSWENLVACCRPCNSKKDDHMLSDMGWKLARKPVAPMGRSWMIVGLGVVEEWEPYLAAA